MPMIDHFQNLIILTSPPASGKTFWVNSFKSHFSESKILFISPLRALADECREKWQEAVVVMTPEEWLGNPAYHEIVIFDEFHLFFYWGNSFREAMWEMFFDVNQKASLTILLTATLSSEMVQEITNFQSQFHQILWVDHGNRLLKYKPNMYLKAPSRDWILKVISKRPMNKEVKLVFCQYRNEVLELEKKLVGLGMNCISCIGGESRHMSLKLKNNPRPDFIISTTVLSHGVNLPEIKEIFFTYSVQNIDFWIQMVARGGRRGEKFIVFALEVPKEIKLNYWSNLAFISWESFKLKTRSSSFLFPKS